MLGPRSRASGNYPSQTSFQIHTNWTIHSMNSSPWKRCHKKSQDVHGWHVPPQPISSIFVPLRDKPVKRCGFILKSV